MKKITLIITLLVGMSIFAQKEELKTLEKTYDMSSPPSQKDIDKVNLALTSLDAMENNLTPEEKNDYNFFKGIQPLMDIFVVAMKNPNDKQLISNALSFEKLISAADYFNKVRDYEKKTAKKIHTDDINKDIVPFVKQLVSQKAYSLNEQGKLKDASNYFYLLYNLNKEEGLNLENAAILAMQSKDYMLAQKYYVEYKNSDYLENGTLYFATNKLTDKEEQMYSREDRAAKLKLGSHEKPRDQKVSESKPEVYKIVAILYAQNGDVENAKKAYKEAKKINKSDIDLLISESRLYQDGDLDTYITLLKEMIEVDPQNASLHFNVGYYSLTDDAKLVDEMNKNLDNSKVFDELNNKRKEMFKKALPYFEKSYQLDPNSGNTKELLKTSYEVLGMKDKADKL